MLAISLMMGLASDLILSSSVTLELAMANRDRVKSEYLAKSGANLGIFVFSLSWAMDLVRAQPTTPAPMRQPLNDGSKNLWHVINKFPPFGSETVDLIQAMGNGENDPFGLRGKFSTKVSGPMSKFEDSFTVRASDEGGKINVNTCASGRCLATIAQLISLFSCPVERSYLDSKD